MPYGNLPTLGTNGHSGKTEPNFKPQRPPLGRLCMENVMTIDEFKAVMAVMGVEVRCQRHTKRALTRGARASNRKCKYPWEHKRFEPNTDCRFYAWLAPYTHVQAFTKCRGHTEKAAIKKLKEWYMYEGRKNANS